MDIQRFAAILLIASFIVAVSGFPFGVPGFYQTQDIAERVRLVEQYHTRWTINKSLTYIWSLLSAAGVGALAVYLRGNGASVTALSGAVSIALGSVFAFLVNYTQYTDLVGYFEGRYPDFHAIANWFILAGLLLLGLAFLQAGLKAWLAYLLIGTAVVLAVALLIWPGIFFAIPFVEMILLPVIGIVLLRQ